MNNAMHAFHLRGKKTWSVYPHPSPNPHPNPNPNPNPNPDPNQVGLPGRADHLDGGATPAEDAQPQGAPPRALNPNPSPNPNPNPNPSPHP